MPCKAQIVMVFKRFTGHSPKFALKLHFGSFSRRELRDFFCPLSWSISGRIRPIFFSGHKKVGSESRLPVKKCWQIRQKMLSQSKFALLFSRDQRKSPRYTTHYRGLFWFTWVNKVSPWRATEGIKSALNIPSCPHYATLLTTHFWSAESCELQLSRAVKRTVPAGWESRTRTEFTWKCKMCLALHKW